LTSVQARLFILSLAVFAFAAVPAFADTIASKQAEAQQVLAQIQELDSQLEKAIEAYDAANVKLDAIHAQVRVNRHEFHVARGNLRMAQNRLGARLRNLYVSGGTDSTLELILGAKSLDDLLSRIDTVKRVSSEDSQVLSEVKKFRVAVARQAIILRNARIEQEHVVAVRATTKRQIQQGLAERQQMLSSIQNEIVRLRIEEAKRQEALRRQLQARLAAQRIQQQQAVQRTVVGVTAQTPDGATVAPPSTHGGAVGIAEQYLGTPYSWGAAGPSAFDCSGLVEYVYNKMGVSLPHNAAAQWGYGSYVQKNQLEPGDLVFFDGLGHVGIYVGNNDFVHAPHTGDVVKISSLSDSWYSSTYVGAKRLN
jgi:cell wall-associated NlpC family hydrolase